MFLHVLLVNVMIVYAYGGCCGSGSLYCGDDKCRCYSGCSKNR